MTDYVKSTSFASKDALATGNPLKIVKGTEIDTEFNNIAVASATKADLLSPVFTGTPTAPTAASGTSTTQLATTAYVINERDDTGTLTNKTLTSPTINGGVITGITALAIADGGTGASTAALAFTALKQPASTSVTGVVQLATNVEASAGMDVLKGLTPSTLRDGLNATGTAPVYACRAWVNFNGTGTVAIRASGNVSSITDNGTGDYTVNFTTALSDINYSISLAAGVGTGSNEAFLTESKGGNYVKTTTAYRVVAYNYNTTGAIDRENVYVQVYR